MSVISLTYKEKRVLAERYDDRKRTFERILKADLRKFFTALESDIFAAIATSRAVDFGSYMNSLTEILRKSYRETGEFFRNHLARLLNTFIPKNSRQKEDVEKIQEVRRGLEPLILLALIPVFDDTARLHAGFILSTTEDVFRTSQGKVLSETIQNGLTLTATERARKIAREVRKRNLKRVPSIADNEVNTAANIALDEEAVKMQGGLSGAAVGTEVMKTWVSIIDKNTRRAHMSANRQKKPVGQPYVVGGQLLRYPKDSSLGASTSNIIGCRCSSITEV